MAVVVVVEVERGGGLLGVVELHGDDQWMQWRQVAIERSIRRQIHGRQKPRDEIGGRGAVARRASRPTVRSSVRRTEEMDGWMRMALSPSRFQSTQLPPFSLSGIPKESH